MLVEFDYELTGSKERSHALAQDSWSTYVSYEESKTTSVSKFTILSFSLLPKFQNGASDFTTASPPPSRFQSHPGMAAHIAAMETRVMAGSLAPSTAADILLDEFMLRTRRDTTCIQQS